MPVRGAIDAVLGRFVIGWAHDPDDPGRRVDLALELDGEFAGTATADLERGDLVVAEIGDGRHAFRFELPHALEPGGEHVLAVRTTVEGVVLALANDFVVELEAGRSGPPAVLSTPDPFSVARVAAVDGEAGEREASWVLLGAEGWLYNLGDLQQVDWLVGRRRLPLDRIARARERLLERRAGLSERGVAYVAAVLPDKLTLYGEHLPQELEPARSGRAVELIAASLRDENGIELLDLLPVLRDARHHGGLMTQTGTALTWTGAFHVYRALAKELAKRWPAIEPLPLTALRLGVEVPLRDSLAARERFVLVGTERVPLAPGAEVRQTEPELISGDLGAAFVPLSRQLEQQLGSGASALEVPDPQISETAIVVHRGAGGRVAALLAEHFSRTLVAVSGDVPYEATQSEGAVVVIELLDEMSLCR